MTHPCQHDGLRFGLGEAPCQRTDTTQYNAGCYGSAWLCPDHRHIATRLCDDADGAMRENAATLSQIMRDERAMTR
jgi:hypothetical protein